MLVREKTDLFVGISLNLPALSDKYWIVDKTRDVSSGRWGKLAGMQNLLGILGDWYALDGWCCVLAVCRLIKDPL